MVLIPSLLIPLKQPGLQLLQGYGPARHPPLSAAAGSARLAAGRCQSPSGRPRWPNEAHGSPRSLMISRGWDLRMRGTMSKKLVENVETLNLISLASWLSSNKGTYRGCRTTPNKLYQIVMCKPQGWQGSLLPATEPKDRPQFPYPTRDVAHDVWSSWGSQTKKNRNTRQHRASSRAPLNITSKAPAMGRNNYNHNDNKNKNQKEAQQQQTFRV